MPRPGPTTSPYLDAPPAIRGSRDPSNLRGPVFQHSCRTESNAPEVTSPLPDLQTAPGHLIRVAQQTHTELWRRAMHGAVTSTQYACLLVVAANPQIDQQTLGNRVSLDRATVTGVVRRMIEAGLLERVQAPGDRRRQLLGLTAHGKEVQQQQLVAAVHVQDAILSPLEPEQCTVLLRRLTQVVGYLDYAKDVPLTSGITLFTAPGHLIRRAQQRHWGLWASTIGEDVTSVQYGVLLGLHCSGPLSQVGISDLASIDKSSVAEMLARLEGRGLLHRGTDPLDRRRKLVEITDQGAATVERFASRVLEVQRLLFEPLDPIERDQFTVLMTCVCRPKSWPWADARVT